MLNHKPIASFWIGTARRKQMPVRPRKLHGLFAEPIITRSGFAARPSIFSVKMSASTPRRMSALATLG